MQKDAYIIITSELTSRLSKEESDIVLDFIDRYVKDEINTGIREDDVRAVIKRLRDADDLVNSWGDSVRTDIIAENSPLYDDGWIYGAVKAFGIDCSDINVFGIFNEAVALRKIRFLRIALEKAVDVLSEIRLADNTPKNRNI